MKELRGFTSRSQSAIQLRMTRLRLVPQVSRTDWLETEALSQGILSQRRDWLVSQTDKETGTRTQCQDQLASRTEKEVKI